MEQRIRDEIELGDRARHGLDQENDIYRPEERELYIRMRVRNAQNHADIKQTYAQINRA